MCLNSSPFLFRGPRKEIINKEGPNRADVEVALEFLIRLGDGLGFTQSHYAMVLDNIVYWMEVKFLIPSKKI